MSGSCPCHYYSHRLQWGGGAMTVSLTTDPAGDSKTENELYVGLWGTSGGREFPLRSKDFDDEGGSFEDGTTRVFLLGWFPAGVAPTEGRASNRTGTGEANNPALLEIDLAGVQYVYLRKQATGNKSDDDDAYRLTRIKVICTAQPPRVPAPPPQPRPPKRLKDGSYSTPLACGSETSTVTRRGSRKSG